MAVAVHAGLSLDPSTPKQLFQFHGTSDFLGGSYDVGVDGQRFLVTALVGEEASPPLTVVINWTAALKTNRFKIKATPFSQFWASPLNTVRTVLQRKGVLMYGDLLRFIGLQGVTLHTSFGVSR